MKQDAESVEDVFQARQLTVLKGLPLTMGEESRDLLKRWDDAL